MNRLFSGKWVALDRRKNIALQIVVDQRLIRSISRLILESVLTSGSCCLLLCEILWWRHCHIGRLKVLCTGEFIRLHLVDVLLAIVRVQNILLQGIVHQS